MLRNRLFYAIVLLLFIGGFAQGAEPPESLELKLPAYTVTRRAGLDYVKIPDGQMLIEEEGRPRVPYYIKFVDYPKGYRVQDVILKERSGMETDSGLKLPVVILSPYHKGPVEMKQGLYPEREFDWNIFENPDGGSKLVIAVYPFYYDPKTTGVKYYRDYRFDIKYVKSGVAITRLTTDKHSYVPEEKVGIQVELENTGKPQDITAAAAIRRPFTDELVAELPPKPLKAVSGVSSAALEWPTKGFPTGHCYVEVILKDGAGNVLDREMAAFRLGIPCGEVTDFEVTPQQFRIGDRIQLSLGFKNTGSCTLSGNGIFEIREADSIIKAFSHDFAKLAPGQSEQFTDVWGTEDAKRSVLYDIIGYVSYEATATLPERVTVSTNLMPTASFTFSPAEPTVGQEIQFDASASVDQDGEIATYRWEFGDGGKAEGSETTHSYYQPGDYSVQLKVTDNEGGTATVVQTVSIPK